MTSTTRRCAANCRRTLSRLTMGYRSSSDFFRLRLSAPLSWQDKGALSRKRRRERAMLHAMIMAGGGGTRFWPRSRQRRPKQFLTLAGDRSLLQQAYDRLEGLAPGRTWVITSEAHVTETANQLPELPVDHIVGEPCGRDTAPCIG